MENIQIFYGDVNRDDAIDAFIRDQATRILRYFKDGKKRSFKAWIDYELGYTDQVEKLYSCRVEILADGERPLRCHSTDRNITMAVRKARAAILKKNNRYRKAAAGGAMEQDADENTSVDTDDSSDSTDSSPDRAGMDLY